VGHLHLTILHDFTGLKEAGAPLDETNVDFNDQKHLDAITSRHSQNLKAAGVIVDETGRPCVYITNEQLLSRLAHILWTIQSGRETWYRDLSLGSITHPKHFCAAVRNFRTSFLATYPRWHLTTQFNFPVPVLDVATNYNSFFFLDCLQTNLSLHPVHASLFLALQTLSLSLSLSLSPHLSLFFQQSITHFIRTSLIC
jgi:hypothetical protein